MIEPHAFRCPTRWFLLAIASTLFVCGGATCAPQRNLATFPPPPTILSPEPTLAEVVAAVNRGDAITQLSTNSASIQDLNQNTPRLTATVHVQRDQDFRLRASLPIMLNAGLDIGSNRDVFWFETPQGMTRALYYARHDQFATAGDRSLLPIDPVWLIDAIGMLHLEASDVIAGPVRRPDGLLELRGWMPDRIHQRVLYLDAAGGFVLRQLVTRPDSVGGETLIAECRTTNHRFDVTTQSVLPHQIHLRLIPVGAPEIKLQIDIGNYVINQLLSGDPNLFVMPQTTGQAYDLTRLSVATPPPAAAGYVAEAAPLGYR